jgi:glycosyltransferase involved in cell wall biosynthesis
MELNKGKIRDLCLVIPTHNNEEYIGAALKEATRIAENIIVVDSSTDSTPSVVKRVAPKARLVLEKKGKGNQLRRGIKEALKEDVGFIAFMDGDGERTAKDIPKMAAVLLKEKADICFGARDRMRSKKRGIFNFMGKFWLDFLTGCGVSDPMAGLTVIKKSALRKLKLGAENFEIEEEIVLESFRNKLKISQCEVIVPKISPSKCGRKQMAQINNFFDRWVLENIWGLDVPSWKKAVLVPACCFGLAIGKIIEKI